MKAFMSDQAVNELPGTAVWADLAVMEARAILAASEPVAPQTAAFAIDRVQGAGRSDGRGRTSPYEGCIALAEALESFLLLDLR